MADAPKGKLVKKGGGSTSAKIPEKHIPVPIPVMPAISARDTFQSGSGSGEFVVHYEVSGLDSLAERLRNMPKYARQAAGIEMSNILWDVIDVAKAIYVPEETGALRDSGMADEYKRVESFDVDFIQLRCWFGAEVSEGVKKEAQSLAGQMGAALPREPENYAMTQHETLFHHYTKPGTGPKYLEKPFMDMEPMIGPRIAAAVGKALGGDVLGLGMDPEIFDGTFGKEFGI